MTSKTNENLWELIMDNICRMMSTTHVDRRFSASKRHNTPSEQAHDLSNQFICDSLASYDSRY